MLKKTKNKENLEIQPTAHYEDVILTTGTGIEEKKIHEICLESRIFTGKILIDSEASTDESKYSSMEVLVMRPKTLWLWPSKTESGVIIDYYGNKKNINLPNSEEEIEKIKPFSPLYRNKDTVLCSLMDYDLSLKRICDLVVDEDKQKAILISLFGEYKANPGVYKHKDVGSVDFNSVYFNWGRFGSKNVLFMDLNREARNRNSGSGGGNGGGYVWL